MCCIHRTHRVGSSNQSHTEDLDKLRKDYDDLETRCVDFLRYK